jgi:hypothetical protein
MPSLYISYARYARHIPYDPHELAVVGPRFEQRTATGMVAVRRHSGRRLRLFSPP